MPPASTTHAQEAARVVDGGCGVRGVGVGCRGRGPSCGPPGKPQGGARPPGRHPGGSSSGPRPLHA